MLVRGGELHVGDGELGGPDGGGRLPALQLPLELEAGLVPAVSVNVGLSKPSVAKCS